MTDHEEKEAVGETFPPPETTRSILRGDFHKALKREPNGGASIIFFLKLILTTFLILYFTFIYNPNNFGDQVIFLARMNWPLMLPLWSFIVIRFVFYTKKTLKFIKACWVWVKVNIIGKEEKIESDCIENFPRGELIDYLLSEKTLKLEDSLRLWGEKVVSKNPVTERNWRRLTTKLGKLKVLFYDNKNGRTYTLSEKVTTESQLRSILNGAVIADDVPMYTILNLEGANSKQEEQAQREEREWPEETTEDIEGNQLQRAFVRHKQSYSIGRKYF